MNISLSGKTAVICGSTQGIGLAIAREFARNGASCILVARSVEALKLAIAELTADDGQQHQYFAADFSQQDQVQEVASKIAAANEVAILINNTGGPAGGPVISAPAQHFVSAFSQHLVCNHLLVQAMVPGMKARNYGRVINIVSTSVKIPINNLGVSNTIRGAVASWSKTMANELGESGITFNNILPGLTDTKRLESLIAATAEREGKTVETVRKEMLHSIPLKRFAQPEETAALAAFLASPAASYITGTSIRVDGGRTGSI